MTKFTIDVFIDGIFQRTYVLLDGDSLVVESPPRFIWGRINVLEWKLRQLEKQNENLRRIIKEMEESPELSSLRNASIE